MSGEYTDGDLCEVCHHQIRRTASVTGNLCGQCMWVNRTIRVCACGHDEGLHFPDSCADAGFWDALQQRRVHCDCQGFTEAAA